ncbi:MAG: hypothetical protein ACTSVI_03765 [Promethearchaeota archaeon]
MKSSTDRNLKKEDIRINDKFIKISSKFSLSILLFVLLVVFTFSLSGLFISAKHVFIMDTLYGLYIWVTIFLVIGFWSYFNDENLFGQFFLILGHFALGYYIYSAILRHEEYYPCMSGIFIFSLILIAIQLVSLLFNLINLLILIPIKRHQQYHGRAKWRLKVISSIKKHKSKILLGVLISATLITPMIYLTSNDNWNLIKIRVLPQDYQAQIAFWGKQDPNAYTSTQRDSLNAFNVTIVHFDTPDINNPSIRSQYISNMVYWRDNYPNVKIIPAIPGIPGGFVWDGAANGTTEYAKDFIQLAIDNNLTNIIGVCFDMEFPVKAALVIANVTSEINRSRHQAAIETWKKFFEWRDANAPNFKVQLVNYYQNALDIFDGDNDLQVISRQNANEITSWDEIAPMIYRADCRGTPPYGDVPYTKPEDACDGHYWLYSKMKILAEAINETYQNETLNKNKLGIYLGITNCTCYGRDVIVNEHGVLKETGFESLVTDALISKSFGTPIITIFLLNTVLDPKNMSMGGVFDSYGDDFLERFNESINGENSSRAFYIFYEPELDSNFLMPGVHEYFMIDLLITLNGFPGILFVIIIVFINFMIIKYQEKIKKAITLVVEKLIRD